MSPADPDNLFMNAADESLITRAPLPERMRPKTLDEIVGQQHLIAPGKPLRSLIETDRLSSVILWGPPGTGKTTIARLIAKETSKAFEALSAVTAGVKDVREVVDRARQRLGERQQGTILFLDEVHRFNKAQQDALLPHVENGLLVLIGATTENPFFELIAPLLSRSTLFRLEPISEGDLKELVERAEFPIAADAQQLLCSRAEGDARHVLLSLEVAASLAESDARGEIKLTDIEAALATRALQYGQDEHYDIISAFIKSIRGSDPDAGLYWLARMLEAGEDARFIARRLVILASEDIGLADSMALVVANAAAHAVEFVGLPEARLNLAHAVVYLSNAPKSNSAYAGLQAAITDVQAHANAKVPTHLRDASYAGAKNLGHGEGYVYPHGLPEGKVEQLYRPEAVANSRYWQPTGRGRDKQPEWKAK